MRCSTAEVGRKVSIDAENRVRFTGQMLSNWRLTFDGELLLHLQRLSAIIDCPSWSKRGAGSYILQVLRLLGVEWLGHFGGFMQSINFEMNTRKKWFGEEMW